MQARVVYRIEITMPGCTYSDAPALSKYMRAITQSSTLSCLKSGATGSMYINIFNTYKVQPSGTHVMASEQDYSTGRLLASNQLKPCTITKDIQGRMLITDCQLIIKSYHPNQRSIYEDKLAQADANESKAIVSRLKFNDVLYEADVNDPVAGTLGIQVNQYLGRMAFIEDKAAATMRLVQNRNVYEFVYQNGKFETTAN